jgi:hypothetical protein
MRVLARLVTSSYCSGERLGEFTKPNHGVTRLETLLTLITIYLVIWTTTIRLAPVQGMSA